MITLYIITHNKTGLKYFGKSELYHSDEDLQKNYKGSGTDWKKHLKEFGSDTNMKVYYQSENIEDVSKIAIEFSRDNNIVKSREWANLREEDGKNGGVGYKFSNETKRKMSLNNIGKHRSKSKSHKQSIAMKGIQWTSETKRRMSEAKVGQPSNSKGKKRSESTKAEMRKWIVCRDLRDGSISRTPIELFKSNRYDPSSKVGYLVGLRSKVENFKREERNESKSRMSY